MIRRLFGVLSAMVLVVTFATISHAQDSTKQMPTNQGKMDMKAMDKGAKMTGPMYSVSCTPDCGFMVQSHDKKEVTGIVIAHAKKMHNKKVTEKEVLGMMKTEEAIPPKE